MHEVMPLAPLAAKRPRLVGDDAGEFLRVALICVCLRVGAGILCRSYGAPDEHWQALEAAHGLAFGAGYPTWEWWPEIRLRSLAPVGALAGVAFTPLRTAALAVWGTDAARALPLAAVWAAPRVAAAASALVADAAVYFLALSTWGGDARAARAAALAHAGSWPALIFGARASANAASAALLAVALAAAQTAVWGGGEGRVQRPIPIAPYTRARSRRYRGRRGCSGDRYTSNRRGRARGFCGRCAVERAKTRRMALGRQCRMWGRSCIHFGAHRRRFDQRRQRGRALPRHCAICAASRARLRACKRD